MNTETYRNLLIKILSFAILLMCAFLCVLFYQSDEHTYENRPNSAYSEVAEKPVSAGDEVLTTVSTNWVIRECYSDGTTTDITEELNASDLTQQWSGLSREDLITSIAAYLQNPSPEDAARELLEIEIESFSTDRIILRKIFAKEQDAFYFLVFQNDFLVVYENDLETIFMNTGIEYEDLPLNHRNEISNCKIIYGQEELFCYLEALTS